MAEAEQLVHPTEDVGEALHSGASIPLDGVQDPIAELVLSGKLLAGSRLTVGVNEDGLTFDVG